MGITNILQSKEWENFQKSLGNQTFWAGDNLLVLNQLHFGKSYLYCPHGPKKLNDVFIKEVKKIARKNKSIFVRIEPYENIQYQISNIHKTKPVQPPSTLILDLKKSEEQLLADMKQKTRYNIRLAEKKGVKIGKTSDPKNIDIFYNILTETTTRDGFRGHSKDYYKKLLSNPHIYLYTAKYNNDYIAANIVASFDGTASYLHGASSNKHRNLMAPYLLQWKAILDAKKNGAKYYDFWGIAPDDPSTPLGARHPWAGITRFKKGFGGEEIHRPGTFDLVISKWWYLLYKIIRFINRIIR